MNMSGIMNIREYWTINKFDFDEGQSICYNAKLSFRSLSLFSLFMKPVLCWRLLEFWAKSSSQVQGTCMRREFESREDASWTSIWNFICFHCQFIVNWNFRCTDGTLLRYSLSVLIFAELHGYIDHALSMTFRCSMKQRIINFHVLRPHVARTRSIEIFPKKSLTNIIALSIWNI